MAGEEQQKEKNLKRLAWETQISAFANPASASQTVWYFCPLEAWDHFSRQILICVSFSTFP